MPVVRRGNVQTMRPYRQRIEGYDGVIHIRATSQLTSPNQNGRWQARCGWIGGKTRGKHVVSTCMECATTSSRMPP